MAAGSDPGMQMQNMSWPQYVSLGRRHMQPGGHKLVQEHFQRYPLGGIMTRELSLSGIETSSLVKRGMQLKEWSNDYTVHPLNAFDTEMANRANEIISIATSTAGAGTSFSQQFTEACRSVTENKTRFEEACKAVGEKKTLFFQSCKLTMKNMKGCLQACETVLAKKSWYWDPCQAMSEIKTWFLEAWEKFLESMPWLSMVCQHVITHKETWCVLMVSVLAVSEMLKRARSRGAENVLKSNDIEDEVDDDGAHIDAPETNSGDDGADIAAPQTETADDGDNDVDMLRTQLNDTMCQATPDDPSGAHPAPTAPPAWAWGQIGPGKDNRRITRRAKMSYRVKVGNNKARWFRADQVQFEGGAFAFHGHDRRRKVTVRVLV